MASVDLVPNLGSIITTAQSYSAVTSSGLTNATVSTYTWRIGQFAFVSGNIAFAGAGGAAADLTVAMPSGLLINTQVLPGTDSSNQGTSMLGYGYWFDNGNGWLFTNPNYLGSTSAFFTINTQHLQMNQFANGDGFKFMLEWIPIQGWS